MNCKETNPNGRTLSDGGISVPEIKHLTVHMADGTAERIPIEEFTDKTLASVGNWFTSTLLQEARKNRELEKAGD